MLEFGFIGLPNIIGSSMSLFNQLHDLHNVQSARPVDTQKQQVLPVFFAAVCVK